jgi:nucleotide-binding universal stress UspA family protein
VHCIWDARATSGPVGPDEEGYDAERLLLAETVAGMAETYPDVAVETALERGLVDRTLVRLGEDAELVVVGTRRRGRIAGLVHGRTASIVAEQSTGIVAVVPEPVEVLS